MSGSGLHGGKVIHSELTDDEFIRFARTLPVFTTGQIARLCRVASRTVSKWFDRNELKGYRIPVSKDRRIPRDQLIRFLKDNDMPLCGLEGGTRSVMLLTANGLMVRNVALAAGADWTLHHAPGGVTAGRMMAEVKPEYVVIDYAVGAAVCDELAELIRGQEYPVRSVVLVPEDKDPVKLMAHLGAMAFVDHPATAPAVTDVLVTLSRRAA